MPSRSRKQAKPRPKLSVRRRIVFSLVTVCIAFVVAEGTFRVFGIGNRPPAAALQFGYPDGIPKFDTDGIEQKEPSTTNLCSKKMLTFFGNRCQTRPTPTIMAGEAPALLVVTNRKTHTELPSLATRAAFWVKTFIRTSLPIKLPRSFNNRSMSSTPVAPDIPPFRGPAALSLFGRGSLISW